MTEWMSGNEGINMTEWKRGNEGINITEWKGMREERFHKTLVVMHRQT